MYCPGGDWEPTPISSGYYSVGGAGTNTRTGQVRFLSDVARQMFGTDLSFPCSAKDVYCLLPSVLGVMKIATQMIFLALDSIRVAKR